MALPDQRVTEPCPVCDDDGWVDINDPEAGGVLGARECPRLDEPGHAPFNATGLLGDRNGGAA